MKSSVGVILGNVLCLAAAAGVLTLAANLEDWVDDRSPPERAQALLEIAVAYIGGEIEYDEERSTRPIIGVNVHLKHSPFLDSALELLEDLPRLRVLNLNGHVTITDAGLDTLEQMNQLRKLDLRGTRVTADGAERLREALPRTKVLHGHDLDEGESARGGS